MTIRVSAALWDMVFRPIWSEMGVYILPDWCKVKIKGKKYVWNGVSKIGLLSLNSRLAF